MNCYLCRLSDPSKDPEWYFTESYTMHDAAQHFAKKMNCGQDCVVLVRKPPSAKVTAFPVIVRQIPVFHALDPVPLDKL